MRQRAAHTIIASAQTGTVLVAAAPAQSLHLAGAVIAAAGGNTATPAVTIKLGGQPVFSHPGVPAGGGLAISGFDVLGGQGEAITIDCDNPGGSVTVMVAFGA